MQSDRYLKAVLTVIAVCLVWICVRDVAIVKPALAAGTMDVYVENWPRVQKVDLYDTSTTVKVDVQNWP